MATLHCFTTTEAPPSLLAQARRVVASAFEPGAFDDDDWDHALGGWHVVVTEGGDVLAHAAVVPRLLHVEDEAMRTGYVEAVGTARARQGEGFGTEALTEIARIVRRGFEMGALSTGRHTFYERLGWERWHGPTFVRDGADVIRTEDEDDGVMVLRFGRSRGVDLTSPLTCDARDGDDW
jgi:aminoglycoside 2'-N-acetyltransferase I